MFYQSKTRLHFFRCISSAKSLSVQLFAEYFTFPDCKCFTKRRELVDIEFHYKMCISLHVCTSFKMTKNPPNVFELLFTISQILWNRFRKFFAEIVQISFQFSSFINKCKTQLISFFTASLYLVFSFVYLSFKWTRLVWALIKVL